MNNRKDCPKCGSRNTNRVHTEWLPDRVEEVRICDECPAQYTNTFGRMIKEVDEI